MRIAPLLCLALAAAAPAAANELGNGDFDTDVSGWGIIEPVSFSWDAFDVDASPTSGSMQLDTHPPPQTTDFHGADSECVAVSAGDPVQVA